MADVNFHIRTSVAAKRLKVIKKLEWKTGNRRSAFIVNTYIDAYDSNDRCGGTVASQS